MGGGNVPGGGGGESPDIGTPGGSPGGVGGGDRFPDGSDDYEYYNEEDNGFIDDIYGEDEDAFEDTFGQVLRSFPTF